MDGGGCVDGGGWQAGMLLWFAEGHLLQHRDEPDNWTPVLCARFYFLTTQMRYLTQPSKLCVSLSEYGCLVLSLQSGLLLVLCMVRSEVGG